MPPLLHLRKSTTLVAPEVFLGATKAVVWRRCKNGGKKWLYGCGSLQPEDAAVVESFQAAFQKAFSMDFYITKYQGKMMESMTPLFQAMLGGMHRLEQQEKEEQEEEARRALAEGGADGEEQTAAKRRRTGEDLARRARRVCIRLASMANRCFWLSTTEVALHILTGGDCPQSHYNVRLFTRQLQWACQQCKRLLNDEGAVEEEQSERLPLRAVRIQIPVADAEEEEHSAGGTAGVPQPAGETVAGDEQAGGEQNEEWTSSPPARTLPTTTPTGALAFRPCRSTSTGCTSGEYPSRAGRKLLGRDSSLSRSTTSWPSGTCRRFC